MNQITTTAHTEGMLAKSSRIDVADALRGFSIMGIVLLHSIEHFNFYYFPEAASAWLRFLDAAVWDALFFTFSGKAYAIFSLLFGFSFFIQHNNQAKKGKDFRLRFVWRLFLLFLWGNINAIFFTAEILVTFAIMGLFLIPAVSLKNKPLMIIAFVCLLQPFEWVKMIYACMNPDFVPGVTIDMAYWGATYKAQMSGTFWEMLKVNLWEGQLAALGWAWENGRFFQIISLFTFGLLIGRTQFFVYSKKRVTQWVYILIGAVLCFFPLYGLYNMLPDFIENKAILAPLSMIVKSISNFCFMLFLMTMILLAFYLTKWGGKWLRKLIPLGKMSLTAYITQSLFGSFIFYNWGLGLSGVLGMTASMLVGVGIFFIQYFFANRWMKNHKHGPLEYVWHKLTWIGGK